MENAALSNFLQFFESESSDSDDLLSEFEDSETSSSEAPEDISSDRRQLHRITNYLQVIEEYDNKEFKEHFRLERHTCKFLIDKLKEENVLPHHHFGRKKISAAKALYITVWYLSNTESFRQISDRFGITKSSAHRSITRVVNYLVENSKNYIRWPSDEIKENIKKEFQKIEGINGIVGAIDGSHIKIKRPKSEHAHVYYNRKGDYSILLQAVATCDKKFIDIFAGEAGSLHDSRLLKKSSLYEKCLSGFLKDDFLLGDSAYPCLKWLISPFKDNGNLSQEQKIFNKKHAVCRIVIENAFGLLKSRFRRLQIFENNNLIFVTKCVIAATVLHNICIDLQDYITDINNEDNAPENYITTTGLTPDYSKRNEILRDIFGNG